MTEKRFTIHKESKYKEEWYAYPFCIKEDEEVVLETIPLSIAEKVRDKLNEQQATIHTLKEEVRLLKPTNIEQYEQIVQLQEENEQLKKEYKIAIDEMVTDYKKLEKENEMLRILLKDSYVNDELRKLAERYGVENE